MKLTSEIMKKAWNIRKKAAKKWNCKVLEISWSECLKRSIVAAQNEERLKNYDPKKGCGPKIKTEKLPDWIKDEDGSCYMPVYC